MAHLDLKTTVINAEAFHLFNEDGTPIPLPPEDGWKWTGDCENPDKELAVELKPGKYWLVRSNNNVTDVTMLTANESDLQREEVGGVANGIPHQAEEVGKVALATPRPVFDLFLEASDLQR